jgi:hypothetical protein
MDLNKVKGNLAASVFGNPKKAFLVIHKNTREGGAGPVEDLAKKALALSSSANHDSASISGIFGGAAGSHVLQVQYNPSSLNFRANSVQILANRLQQNVISNIQPQFTEAPTITMTVELVFDAMNKKDSFTADKFESSPGGLAAVAPAIVNRSGYTVQPQTNALLAMLLRQSTNFVSFYWAGMVFSGQVMEAIARYVMFSVSGRPVRSMVRLVLKQKLEGADVSYWDKAFDKCFSGGAE